MNKIIDSVKSWNKERHERNRVRLWNKLTKLEQLELTLQVINRELRENKA